MNLITELCFCIIDEFRKPREGGHADIQSLNLNEIQNYDLCELAKEALYYGMWIFHRRNI